MGFKSKIRQAGLGVLSALAMMTAGTAAVVTAATPQQNAISEQEMSGREIKVADVVTPVGPGRHAVWQRPLTGLEIRAVRKQSRCIATNRQWRSKYIPTGIPCRVTKAATFLAAKLKQQAA